MADYIEKQAARPDEFCVGVSCQECPFLKDPLYGGCRVDDFIMALPPADVRPVVRGHWVPMDDFPHEDWECDVCGACLCGDESIPQDLNYCPNCGAWMRGDAE